MIASSTVDEVEPQANVNETTPPEVEEPSEVQAPLDPEQEATDTEEEKTPAEEPKADDQKPPEDPPANPDAPAEEPEEAPNMKVSYSDPSDESGEDRSDFRILVNDKPVLPSAIGLDAGYDPYFSSADDGDVVAKNIHKSITDKMEGLVISRTHPSLAL